MENISLFSFRKTKGIFCDKTAAATTTTISSSDKVWDNVQHLKEVTIQLQSKILWHLYVVIC